MKIIVEGPDGVGKSTLVNYIANKYNLSIYHSSSETKNDLEYHEDLISKDNVILDRANLGEIVYPLVYNRETKMDWDKQIDFMNECQDEEIIYIIMYASDFEDLKSRLYKRGDTNRVLENAEKINIAFKLLAEQFSSFYDNVYCIDISKVEDQKEWFDNIIL